MAKAPTDKDRMADRRKECSGKVVRKTGRESGGEVNKGREGERKGRIGEKDGWTERRKES